MNKITLAQREALDVVKDMIDKSNTNVPEYGTKIMTLILGILNIDCRVEHNTIDITDIEGDKTLPINPNNGNDRLQINLPNWPPQTPPFSPHAPYPEQIWYDKDPGAIKIDAHEHQDVRYATSISCTGDKNCITTTYNPNEVQYTGDFRDTQTSFNDK